MVISVSVITNDVFNFIILQPRCNKCVGHHENDVVLFGWGVKFKFKILWMKMRCPHAFHAARRSLKY
ncbi:CLUMA_CG009192, isoform A [Clunio marinus]|uniref:CLUMA_CG009192, isoform A n=1 Tax=Clunio marinus TaxID=568069 RepID=A0A1J1I5X9_9DIPT|nr:CLUMA_CG009192, isoform A [Clunio marinus]